MPVSYSHLRMRWGSVLWIVGLIERTVLCLPTQLLWRSMFLPRITLCSLLVSIASVVPAQDSVQTILRRYADAAYAERLVSVRGYQEIYHTPIYSVPEEDSLDMMDRTRGSILSVMSGAARARDTYTCYRRLNDSLNADAPKTHKPLAPEEQMSAMADRRRILESQCWGQGFWAEFTPEYRMRGVPLDSVFPSELPGLLYSGGLLDSVACSLSQEDVFQRLRSAGLIDRPGSVNIERGIRFGHFETTAALLEEAKREMTDRPRRRRQQAAQRKWVRELIAQGRLDSSGQVLDTLFNGPYHCPWDEEIFSLLQGSIVLDSCPTPCSTSDFFRAGYEAITRLFPGISWGALNINTDTVSIEGGPRSTLIADLSLSANGNQYSNRTLDGSIDPDEVVVRYDDAQLFRLRPLLSCANKALCDAGDQKRLFGFQRDLECDTCEFAYRISGYTLVAVDRDLFHSYYAYKGWGTASGNAHSYEGFLDRFCRADVDSLVTRLRSIGVLDNIGEQALDSSLTVANQEARSSWPEVLSCFPHLLVRLSWTWPSHELKFAELAQASGGRFEPSHIKIRSHGKGLFAGHTVQFVLQGKSFRKKFEAGGRNHLFLAQAANDALAKAGVDGRFCPMRDEHPWAVFLTRAQYDALHDGFLSDYFDPWETKVKSKPRY